MNFVLSNWSPLRHSMTKNYVNVKLSNCTDAQISLHTLLVKYYNYSLSRHFYEQGRDEVTYFFVHTLALCMPIFKKKSSRRFLEKMPKLFIPAPLKTMSKYQARHCSTLLIGCVNLFGRLYN